MTALTVFVVLSPLLNNGRWYLLQVASCHVTVHQKSSFPTRTVNKMQSRRGHNTRQLCLTPVSRDQPTHPIKLIKIRLPLCFFSSLYFFLHLFFSPLLLSFVFLSLLPSCSLSLLLAIEVNRHLYYTALQLINNMPGRKKNNPHLLSSFSLSLSLSGFFSPL